MKSEEIKDLFLKFETAASDLEGIECWNAGVPENYRIYLAIVNRRILKKLSLRQKTPVKM